MFQKTEKRALLIVRTTRTY